MHLPGIRHLSLQYAPPLAPMEPATDGVTTPYGSLPSQQIFPAGGPRISEIMDQAESTNRKLPLPKVAVQEMLNPGSGFSSGSSSQSGIEKRENVGAHMEAGFLRALSFFPVPHTTPRAQQQALGWYHFYMYVYLQWNNPAPPGESALAHTSRVEGDDGSDPNMHIARSA
ncbi:MAG: hypothetical protein Q9173_002723 [Seirophora scorigena]